MILIKGACLCISSFGKAGVHFPDKSTQRNLIFLWLFLFYLKVSLFFSCSVIVIKANTHWSHQCMIIKLCFLIFVFEYLILIFLDSHASTAPSTWEIIKTEKLVYCRWPPIVWDFSRGQSTIGNEVVKNINDGKTKRCKHQISRY